MSYSNAIVTGGGTEVRRNLSVNFDENDLVITNSNKSRYYKGSKATVCTTGGLANQPYGNFSRVIIDINIPTVKTRRFSDLVRLCEGRTVIVVALVYEQDRKALARIVAKSLNAEVMEVKPQDVEVMLAELQSETKTRYVHCPECMCVNQSKNRTKDNPMAMIICTSCLMDFAAFSTPNWLQ